MLDTYEIPRYLRKYYCCLVKNWQGGTEGNCSIIFWKLDLKTLLPFKYPKYLWHFVFMGGRETAASSCSYFTHKYKNSTFYHFLFWLSFRYEKKYLNATMDICEIIIWTTGNISINLFTNCIQENAMILWCIQHNSTFHNLATL